MCTLTVYADSRQCILTMNRDELRERHEAGLLAGTGESPRLCYPVDGLAGGTWMGVNEHGVALCLLNRYEAYAPRRPRSRGGIIPAALERGGAGAVLGFLHGLDCAPYPPFDLYFATRGRLRHFRWDGGEWRERPLSADPWFMCSSSLLQPQAVLPYRETLFAERAPRAALAADPGEAILRGYHFHREAGDPLRSVLTEREHSHTKSVTQVRLEEGRARLDYFPEVLSRPGGQPLRFAMDIRREDEQ